MATASLQSSLRHEMMEASRELDGLFADEKGHKAYVIYIPGLGGPRGKSTAVWLERMTHPRANYFF